MTDKQKIPFEDAVKELEKTVKIMESGDLGLDQLLEQYERGIHLLRCCEAKLAEAEGKIEVLTQKEIKTESIEKAEVQDGSMPEETEEIPLPEEPLTDENTLF